MAAAVTIRCEKCGRTNRVPAAADGRPRCGACREPLAWIVDASDDDFVEVVDESTVPVLVDMWASWCGPCRMVSPALERVARELAGRIKLVKVNIDESPGLAAAFSTRAVPALLVVNRGEVVAERAGAAPLHELRNWVKQAIEKKQRQERAPAGHQGGRP